MRKLNKLLLLGLLVAVPFAACDDDDGDGVVTPPTGTIRGTVTVEGSGTSGVSVQLSGPESRSTQTGSDGSYSFTEVPAGSYVVSISGTPSDATFPQTAKSAVISSEGQSVTVNFDGSFIRTSGIAGTVTAGGNPLAGVSVSLSGAGSASTTTDTDGGYAFSGLRSGSYTVSISGFDANKFTFPSTEKSTSVAAGETKSVNFQGSEASTAQITSTVTIDGSAAEGIDVAISGPASDSKATDASGQAVFSGLPRGTYQVTISGFDANNVEFDATAKSVTIEEIGGSASVSFTGSTIASGTIQGSVTAPSGGLSGAEVTLDGGVSVDTTDSNGEYSFTGLTAGDYTIDITNPDSDNLVFSETSKTATLATGSDVATVNFTATHRTDGSVAGTVTAGGDAVADHQVIIEGGVASLTDTTTTDSTGAYSFSDLSRGTYVVSTTEPANFTGSTSQSTTLASGVASNTGVDFTFSAVANATISGFVFDNNGDPFASPPTLTLWQGGSPIDTTQTAVNTGAYTFEDLAVGDYTVMIDSYDADNFIFLSDGSVQLSQSVSITSAGQNVQNVDFEASLRKEGTISGTLLLHDGSNQAGAEGLEVTAWEVDDTGAAIGSPMTKTTDASGAFTFGDATADAQGGFYQGQMFKVAIDQAQQPAEAMGGIVFPAFFEDWSVRGEDTVTVTVDSGVATEDPADVDAGFDDLDIDWRQVTIEAVNDADDGPVSGAEFTLQNPEDVIISDTVTTNVDGESVIRLDESVFPTQSRTVVTNFTAPPTNMDKVSDPALDKQEVVFGTYQTRIPEQNTAEGPTPLRFLFRTLTIDGSAFIDNSTIDLGDGGVAGAGDLTVEIGTVASDGTFTPISGTSTDEVDEAGDGDGNTNTGTFSFFLNHSVDPRGNTYTIRVLGGSAGDAAESGETLVGHAPMESSTLATEANTWGTFEIDFDGSAEEMTLADPLELRFKTVNVSMGAGTATTDGSAPANVNGADVDYTAGGTTLTGASDGTGAVAAVAFDYVDLRTGNWMVTAEGLDTDPTVSHADGVYSVSDPVTFGVDAKSGTHTQDGESILFRPHGTITFDLFGVDDATGVPAVTVRIFRLASDGSREAKIFESVIDNGAGTYDQADLNGGGGDAAETGSGPDPNADLDDDANNRAGTYEVLVLAENGFFPVGGGTESSLNFTIPDDLEAGTGNLALTRNVSAPQMTFAFERFDGTTATLDGGPVSVEIGYIDNFGLFQSEATKTLGGTNSGEALFDWPTDIGTSRSEYVVRYNYTSPFYTEATPSNAATGTAAIEYTLAMTSDLTDAQVSTTTPAEFSYEDDRVVVRKNTLDKDHFLLEGPEGGAVDIQLTEAEAEGRTISVVSAASNPVNSEPGTTITTVTTVDDAVADGEKELTSDIELFDGTYTFVLTPDATTDGEVETDLLDDTSAPEDIVLRANVNNMELTLLVGHDDADDGTVEGKENRTVTLEDADGASLGSLSSDASGLVTFGPLTIEGAPNIGTSSEVWVGGFQATGFLTQTVNVEDTDIGAVGTGAGARTIDQSAVAADQLELIATNGTVSGEVRDPSNATVEGVKVVLYRFDGADADDGDAWVVDQTTQTGTNGQYQFTDVEEATGTANGSMWAYRVRIEDNATWDVNEAARANPPFVIFDNTADSGDDNTTASTVDWPNNLDLTAIFNDADVTAK